jgi:DegV family protein with EDD domain
VGEGLAQPVGSDANSQLPGSLAERYGIEVVPLTVTVNGVEHLEGVDLTHQAFYAAWDGAEAPTITTSQPSPGQFVEAYQRLIERGCTEILSVRITEAMSRTLNSARLAAQMVDVPVRMVDSGTASFEISCCAWAAADATAEYALSWTPSAPAGLRVAIGTSDISSALVQ